MIVYIFCKFSFFCFFVFQKLLKNQLEHAGDAIEEIRRELKHSHLTLEEKLRKNNKELEKNIRARKLFFGKGNN